jgi:hypothetical protein
MRYATERDNGTRMHEHLGTGGPFPDLELPDHTGSLRRLSELTAGDPLFLNFYRGFWCPQGAGLLPRTGATPRRGGGDLHPVRVGEH